MTTHADLPSVGENLKKLILLPLALALCLLVLVPPEGFEQFLKDQ